jgi:uncharacterized protein
MPDIIIKHSPIEGKGVFAAREFQKGEVVLRWDLSHPVDTDLLTRLPEHERRYVAVLEGKSYLLMPPERYVNHSCEPNTTARNFCDVAKRDINKGEEITGDYSEEAIPGFEMRCTCGSQRCRRIITGKKI